MGLQVACIRCRIKKPREWTVNLRGVIQAPNSWRYICEDCVRELAAIVEQRGKYIVRSGKVEP